MANGQGQRDGAGSETWINLFPLSQENDGHEYVDMDADGFSGFVPASLEELTSCEDMQTAHLVEGEFFTETLVIKGNNKDENKIANTTLQTQKLQEEKPQHDAGVTAGDGGGSSLVAKSKKRAVKRVRWADEEDCALPLVSHAMKFATPQFVQQQTPPPPPHLLRPLQRSEPKRVTEAMLPPPAFRKEVNDDGTPYFSCKAQRPAQRFVLWRRGVLAGTAAAGDCPFKRQPPPNVNFTTPCTTALFAALCPPYNAEHVGATVLMRSATISQEAMVKNALCNGGLQMPLVRSLELVNVPLNIPF